MRFPPVDLGVVDRMVTAGLAARLDAWAGRPAQSRAALEDTDGS